jgi:hypothetical protein
VSASAPGNRDGPADHGRIVSDVPGRLRIRVHRSLRHPDLIRQVHGHLQAHEGIHQVESSAATGSVVVRYDPNVHSRDDVLGICGDIGLIVRDLAAGLGEEVPELGTNGAEGHSTTARSIIDSVDDLDRRLSRLTGRRVDLRLLFPLTLGALGLRQVLRGGLGLAEVPGYILLWYAFDAFWKMHQERPPLAATGPDATEPGGPPPAVEAVGAE